MGHLRKIKDPKTKKPLWEYTVSAGNDYYGKRRRLVSSSQDKHIAQLRALKKYEKLMKQDEELGIKLQLQGQMHQSNSITLEEFTTANWDEINGTASVATRRQRLSVWKNHICPVLGKRQLGTLTAKNLSKYLNKTLLNREFRGRKLTNNINHYKLLNLILNFAVEQKKIAKNPLEDLKNKPKSNMRSNEIDSFPDDLPRDIYNVVERSGDGYLFCYMIFRIFLGLRSSELAGLTVESVSIEDCKAFIVNQLDKPRGEEFQLRLPKGNKTRTVPLPEVVLEPLQALIDRAESFPENKIRTVGSVRGINRPEFGTLLFTNEKGKPLYKDKETILFHIIISMVEDVFPKYQNLPYIKPHTGRRMAVSLLVDKGMDWGKIQSIIGHADREMLEHYNSVSSEKTRESLDDIFSEMGYVGDRSAKEKSRVNKEKRRDQKRVAKHISLEIAESMENDKSEIAWGNLSEIERKELIADTKEYNIKMGIPMIFLLKAIERETGAPDIMRVKKLIVDEDFLKVIENTPWVEEFLFEKQLNYGGLFEFLEIETGITEEIIDSTVNIAYRNYGNEYIDFLLDRLLKFKIDYRKQ